MVDRPTEAVSVREGLVVAAIIVAAIALLPLVGGTVLWTRPFWLDELCCVVNPTEHASTPLDVIRNIARNDDYAPPMLHLMAWVVGKVAGFTPIALHSMSALCVGLALGLVYLTLRRRFDVAASAAGAIAVACHPLVITHAFEARFYGPWLLFAAAFAWSLGRRVAMAVAAVCLVTIHWFGVLSLGVMTVAAVASRGREWRRGLRDIAPAGAGLVAFGACLPLLLSNRASAVTIGVLWVPGLSLAQVEGIARLFYAAAVPGIAAAIIAVMLVIDHAVDGRVRANSRALLRDPGLAALASLALMPALLIVVSIAMQPSLLDRYAILTVLSWAPLVALAVSTLRRAPRLAALAALVLMAASTMRTSIAQRREESSAIAATQRAYDAALATRLPIVFPSVLTLYPVAGPAHDQSALFLDMPDSTINALVPQPRLDWLRRNITVERNIARGHHRQYGFPELAPQARLDTTRRFLMIATDESLPRLYQRADLFAAAVFPHHVLRRLTPELSLLERRDIVP